MAASLTRRRAAVSGLCVFTRQGIFLRQPLRKTEPCRTLQTAVAVRQCGSCGTLQTAHLWSRSAAVALPDRRNFATLAEKDSVAVDPKLLLKYFQVVAKELRDVETELLRRSLDAKRTKELNEKVARLSGIVRLFEKVNTLRKEVDGLKDLEKDFARTGDNEMLTMALDDLKNCESEMQDIYDQILEQIVPPDPVDSSEVLLELTAGVGGQEAMLFTGDIMEMYMHYCRWKGWTCTPLDYETADQGGVRHASLSIGGRDVGKFLKFESGVHRVQRVPATEKSGRIHTSTMAVAVMPMPSENRLRLMSTRRT
uniref:Peptide chain release factor 1 n=1 Tax=Rhipicephalus appendiculatus TaxID=34631 RepID=A0A131YL89_RHIAP